MEIGIFSSVHVQSHAAVSWRVFVADLYRQWRETVSKCSTREVNRLNCLRAQASVYSATKYWVVSVVELALGFADLYYTNKHK